MSNESSSATSSGWNRPRQSAECGVPSAKKRVLGAWCLVLGAVCLVVGGAALLLWPEGERGEDVASTERGRIREVKPAKARSAESEVRRAKKPKPKTVEEAMANLEEQPKPEIKKRELSPEEWDRLTNRVFQTGTEQLMSWVFTTEPGDMPMPIPNISKKDRDNIIAVLFSKNEIKETDSEKVKFCKEQVDAAKKEMIAYIKQGGDPDDFLQYYYHELRSCFETRREAIRQAQHLFDEDPELGRAFVEKVNEKFEKDGIKQIKKEQFE